MKTGMKKFVSLVGMLGSMAVLPGCGDLDLAPYFSQLVKFDAGKLQSTPAGLEGSGRVTFKHSHAFQNSREVCDSRVCGSEPETECDNVERCTGGGTECTPIQRCNANGCVNDQVCRTYPGSCTTDQVCRTYDRPVYCDVNCRDEPFTDYNVTTLNSAIQLVLVGMSASQKGKIEQLELGVKTNSQYLRLFDEPKTRPDGSQGLFETIRRGDHTILALKAKGMKLSNDRDFLRLPADFKKGDPVRIEVRVESVRGDNEVLSAIGTESDFPALQTND